MLEFSHFMAIYAGSLAGALALCLLLLVKPLSAKKGYFTLRKNLPYIVALIALPLAVVAADMLDISVSGSALKEARNTDWIMQVSGGVVSGFQTRLNYGLVTDFSMFLYVWIFAFVTAFSPIF